MEGDRENLYNYVPPADIEGMGYTKYPKPISATRLEGAKSYFFDRCMLVEASGAVFKNVKNYSNADSFLSMFSWLIYSDLSVLFKHPAELQEVLSDAQIKERLISLRDDIKNSGAIEFMEKEAKGNMEKEQLVENVRAAIMKLEIYLASVK